MSVLDRTDSDGDRFVLYDFNEDTPLSARPTTDLKTEALLRVHQYTAMEDGGPDPDEGASVLIDKDAGSEICKWLIGFFDLDVNEVLHG